MKALITGASAGLGRDMAIQLSKRGFDLILVARREDRLNELKEQLKNIVNVQVYPCDLTDENAVKALYKEYCEQNIDVLINNAGFGSVGYFDDVTGNGPDGSNSYAVDSMDGLDSDINMIKTNVIALHMLTKLFLRDFKRRDHGFILNVASVAGFMPGPMMATYYSTKNYVYRLSQAIFQEIKYSGRNVHISVLCPGPVKTEFNKVAKVSFGMPGANSKRVAKYAIDKLFEGKFRIIPGVMPKLFFVFSRLIPDSWMMPMIGKFQKAKIDNARDKKKGHK